MKTLFSSLFLLMSILTIKAHTVWIETSTVARINQPQEIKVFFGELDDITPTQKWFSNLKDFEITITTPSGTMHKISEKTQKENYYSLKFIPKENGTYVVNLRHIVKDLHNKMKITYQSGAIFSTNPSNSSAKTIGVSPRQFELSSHNLKINKENKVIILSDGDKKKWEKVTIIAPNTWRKDLYSNEEGVVNFVPLWKGDYMVEYVLQKNENGTHEGLPYETNYEVITIKMYAK